MEKYKRIFFCNKHTLVYNQKKNWSVFVTLTDVQTLAWIAQSVWI